MTDRILLLDVAGTPERKPEPELGSLLASCGFSVRCAGDIDAAIVMLGEHAPSLAVINIGSAKLVDADHALRLATLRVDEPPPRQGGGKVADVAELVDKLKNEAGVI